MAARMSCKVRALCLLAVICLGMTDLCVAAPLNANADNKAVAKRSNEVIFFENQQKGAGLNKRSEPWPANQDKAEQVPAKSALAQGSQVEEADVPALTEELIEAVEEKAFYEAVEFVVDRLVDGVYESGELDLPEDYDNEKPAAGSEETPAAPVTEDSDSEAEQLASLIQQAKLAQTGEQHKDVPRAGNSEAKPEPVNSVDKSPGAVQEATKGSQQGQMPTTTAPLDIEDYENYGLTDEAPNFANMLDYLNYLNTLKTVENKLKAQLQEDSEKLNEQETRANQKGGAKSRSKRSLESMNLRMTGSGERSAESQVTGNAEGGLCFTAEEVAELKALLIQLAQEKIEAEDLIGYLLGADNIDSTAEEEYAYPDRQRDSPQSDLYRLGSRLSQPGEYQQVPASGHKYPTIYSGWPYEKK